jgi:hypothetical protein
MTNSSQFMGLVASPIVRETHDGLGTHERNAQLSLEKNPPHAARP